MVAKWTDFANNAELQISLYGETHPEGKGARCNYLLARIVIKTGGGLRSVGNNEIIVESSSDVNMTTESPTLLVATELRCRQ